MAKIDVRSEHSRQKLSNVIPLETPYVFGFLQVIYAILSVNTVFRLLKIAESNCRKIL